MHFFLMKGVVKERRHDHEDGVFLEVRLRL
jgi:hypothetical protein